MKGCIVALGLVCFLTGGAAGLPLGQATYTGLGTYLVEYEGTQTTVDVWTVTLHSPSGLPIASVEAKVGSNTGMGDDPFQVGKRVPYDILGDIEWDEMHTPTQATLVSVIPSSEETLRPTDSRFLPYDPNDPNKNIEHWYPMAVSPWEYNVASIYDPGYQTSVKYVLGTGSLQVSTGIPVSSRTQDLLLVQVGIVPGTTVWITGTYADSVGGAWEIPILPVPEPATMSLLGLGALPLLPRRGRAGLKA